MNESNGIAKMIPSVRLDVVITRGAAFLLPHVDSSLPSPFAQYILLERLDVLAAERLLQRLHRLFRVRRLYFRVSRRVSLELRDAFLHLLILPLERLRHLRLVLFVHRDDLQPLLLSLRRVFGIRFFLLRRGELSKRVNLLRQRL